MGSWVRSPPGPPWFSRGCGGRRARRRRPSHALPPKWPPDAPWDRRAGMFGIGCERIPPWIVLDINRVRDDPVLRGPARHKSSCSGLAPVRAIWADQLASAAAMARHAPGSAPAPTARFDTGRRSGQQRRPGLYTLFIYPYALDHIEVIYERCYLHTLGDRCDPTITPRDRAMSSWPETTFKYRSHRTALPLSCPVS